MKVRGRTNGRIFTEDKNVYIRCILKFHSIPNSNDSYKEMNGSKTESTVTKSCSIS